jgi:hypothetical protein
MRLPLVWSPGYGAPVFLGDGQARTYQQLQRVAARHPSRTWHDAPPMRGFGVSPGTAHRLVHGLARRGVVAVQSTLGCHGVVRFTFGVHRFLWRPPRRAQVARITAGQLELLPPDDQAQDRLKPPEQAKPPETAPLERPRTPENGESGVRVQSEFARKMAAAGLRAWGRE